MERKKEDKVLDKVEWTIGMWRPRKKGKKGITYSVSGCPVRNGERISESASTQLPPVQSF